MTSLRPLTPASVSVDRSLALLVEEWTTRLQAGEATNEEAFLAKHPAHADELRLLLPALWAMAELGRSGVSIAAGVSPEEAMGRLGDFRIVREIGRGGMGIVYEAEQVSLQRRVALKLLPFAATMDARRLQRFLNEARAAASLHHTNIVPVHFVGSERGVHYYAMQFIEGRDLASVIAQLRLQASGKVVDSLAVPTVDADDGEAVGPSAAAADTRPIAGLSTEGSTKTVEHFRTVARLGIQAAEGLDHAHQMGIVHRDVKPANLLVDATGRLWVTDFGLAQLQADTGLTLTGDLVGTLRYMSPEQALAKRVVVDHRTDVYSLGATLYELLTLQPAFDSRDRHELLRQVAFEEPRPLRRLNSAIPPELETITLKAMEKNPAERYATAQDLADDLRNFVDDRPIRAKRPALLQRLMRWRRRHKALVWSVAGLVLMVGLLGGAVLGWQQRQRAATEQAVGEDLREADLFEKQERWSEELQVLERASGRLAAGGSTQLRERVEQRRTNVALVAQLEEARLQRSAAGAEGLDNAGADQAYAAAFASFGLDLETLAPAEAAERIQTSPIRRQLVAALDDWTFIKKQLRAGSEEPLRVVARLADDDPWRQQLRDPKVRKDRAALERLAQAEGVLAQPPGNLTLLSRALEAVKGQAAAVRLLRGAQQRHPADFWINFDLALGLSEEPATLAEAIGFYRAALALRPQSPVVYNNLGNVLRDQKKLAEAEAVCRKAIELKPDFAGAYVNLGNALRDQKKLAEAEAACRKAIALQPDFALAYSNLGNALREQKKLAQAEAACRKAIALQPDFALAYSNLGNVLRDQKKLAQAEAACRKAIELKPDFASAHTNLGNALWDQKKLAEAEAAHRKAIELKPDFADAYNNLGNALHDQKKLAEAEAARRKAIALQPDFAEAHYNLGNALHDQKKLAEAVAAYRKAIELKPDFAAPYCNLGNALAGQKKLAQAVAAFRKAIELQPNDAIAYDNLGNALGEQKKLAEAVAACRKAIELQPDYADAYCSLGNALHDQQKLAEAAAAFRKAIALKPDYAKAYYNLGIALTEQGKLAEAEAACRKAIELKPDCAGAYNNLGNALRDQKKLAEAVAAFRKAIELQPDFAEAYHNLGLALKDQQKLAEAVAAFRKAIELKRDCAQAHGALGLTLLQQGQFTQGEASTRRARGLLPPDDPRRLIVSQQLNQCRHCLALEKKLPDVLAGKLQPANAAERAEYAGICLLTKRFAAAARLFAEAFADPKLANNLQAGHRYNAACAAALAGCGQGKDAGGLDAKERERLRRQALTWLRTDIAVRQRQLKSWWPGQADEARAALRHWQTDADLAGVRGAEAIARLPEAERQAWQKLWSDVAQTLAGAQKKAASDKK